MNDEKRCPSCGLRHVCPVWTEPTKWTLSELREKANEWDAVSVNGDIGQVARAVMVRFLAFLESLDG